MNKTALACLVLIFGLLSGCGEPDARERLLARGATTHYEIRLAGALAGRLEVRRSERPTFLEITVLSILDPPGGGRLETERRYRYGLRPPYALLEGQLSARLPQGALFRQPLRTPPTLPRWLAGAGQVAQAGGTLGPDGVLERLPRGDSFLLQRVPTAPTLPAAPAPQAPLFLPLRGAPTGLTRHGPWRLALAGPAAALWPNSPATASDEAEQRELRPQVAGPVPPALLPALEGAIAAVRSQLRYVPGAYLPSLDHIPDQASGDCYEFAGLLQKKLDALGLESETKLGLTMNAEGTGFGLHAWNVVRFNGQPIPVDATLNQLPADPTHLPFPDDPARQLDLQLALAQSTLHWLAP
ncbi:MAG: transglutaminase domain-containing protein [Pseudomonadales bacterium]|nr:transglutaminase domain-containing protein [Pseudomonadales bacterium]